ncbi:MAG TPA: ATPase, partial [Cryomorphaceae bacterium]|nr:ATPase [Cryomorphaceae bacterium]
TVFGTRVEENMDIISDIYNQLKPFKDRLAGKLSGGMKQKLALCCALIHRPQVLFLDEPTTGVDPVSRKEFWQMLKKLKESGITILVSTPYMDEAALCDRVALIQEGQILSIESPASVSASYPFELIAMKSENMYALLQQLRQYSEVHSSYTFGDFIHVSLKKGESEENLLRKLKEDGFEVEHEKIKAGIENVFMQLLSQKEEV